MELESLVAHGRRMGCYNPGHNKFLHGLILYSFHAITEEVAAVRERFEEIPLAEQPTNRNGEPHDFLRDVPENDVNFLLALTEQVLKGLRGQNAMWNRVKLRP